MLLLIAAAPLETALLRPQLENPVSLETYNYLLLSGSLGNQQVILAHSGIGQAAMAMQLTRLLERHRFSAVLLFGCAGCYPDSGLKNGDLTLASSEIFGDVGVATDAGFTPLDQLQIPLEGDLAPPVRQELSLSGALLDWACRVLPEARSGPFVTVNCCSGTLQLSDRLFRQTHGICENMEGAAAALVCAEYNLPLLEVRGISNPTGTRDTREWDLKLGAEVAQRAVIRLLEHWPSDESVCGH